MSENKEQAQSPKPRDEEKKPEQTEAGREMTDAELDKMSGGAFEAYMSFTATKQGRTK